MWTSRVSTNPGWSWPRKSKPTSIPKIWPRRQQKSPVRKSLKPSGWWTQTNAENWREPCSPKISSFYAKESRLCKPCAESVQPLSYIKKERQILRFDVQNLVHLQGLEPWAHWLREQAAGSSQFVEVSIHRCFWTRQRDFLPSNFCTLCRILQRKAPSARFETVQNPCRNRALTLWQTKITLSTTDLTAMVWVTDPDILNYLSMFTKHLWFSLSIT